MTAQMNDTVFHKRKEYSLAGISGDGLFTPETIGLKVRALSTACWRGYVACYKVSDGQLFLQRLQIGLQEDDATVEASSSRPSLFGVTPKIGHYGERVFEDLLEPMAFTGGLLLADSFISALYVHMGFHPAWKYKVVREVIFDRGKMIEDIDRSEEMATLRKKMQDANKDRPSKKPSREELEQWIERSFSREYRRSV